MTYFKFIIYLFPDTNCKTNKPEFWGQTMVYQSFSKRIVLTDNYHDLFDLINDHH